MRVRDHLGITVAKLVIEVFKITYQSHTANTKGVVEKASI